MERLRGRLEALLSDERRVPNWDDVDPEEPPVPGPESPVPTPEPSPARAVPRVGVGARVDLVQLDGGGERIRVHLVEGRNDPDHGQLSVHTPLGAAVLGAEEGDEVEYVVGSYLRRVRVLRVEVAQPGVITGRPCGSGPPGAATARTG